ncbi:protein-glutamate O-methyltransferase CheR [Anaeromyxobacter sp. SG17]|uniref:CheR family methyltransferase n=1 Tax=Anaeromyxobacter sp. SG17 TaxID=2925405 RepID=UPI001F58A130|nr:protein-glutamate O-methyltransferase CheR [Anaeromyxobacter sp. SG17]
MRAEVEAILALIRERSGVDFQHHRPHFVERRLRQRMASAGVHHAGDYLALIAEDPAEVFRAVERLTIKVSRFFRDARAAEVACAAARGPRPARRGLRAWSAGCARGEEAYTLALLLGADTTAPEILATDVDPLALSSAAEGKYLASALADVPPAFHAAFEPAPPSPSPGPPGALSPCSPGREPPRRVRLRPGIRRRVRFARHDLCGDAPPAGAPFDLVACRNVLIYFQPELQERVFHALLAAVRPGGVLWLGEAEWPCASVLAELEVLDPAARVFRRRRSA